MYYAIEPTDHWRGGDRAYCVQGLKKDGRYILETGRVYSVAEAEALPGMMSDGLRLADVDPGGVWGFWSNRFVCIRGREPALEQIAKRTRRKWLEAYAECRDARARDTHPKDGDAKQGSAP